MITNKKHNRIIKELQEEYAQKHKKLTEELKEDKDLKLILEKLYPVNEWLTSIGSITTGSYELRLPDTVLQYTENILGGEVIKQEGIKCLIVDKDGNVKTGLTKQKADKGYSYKLIRN